MKLQITAHYDDGSTQTTNVYEGSSGTWYATQAETRGEVRPTLQGDTAAEVVAKVVRQSERVDVLRPDPRVARPS